MRARRCVTRAAVAEHTESLRFPLSRALRRLLRRSRRRAALRATVAQVKSARAERDSDAKAAALVAEQLSEAARQTIEDDLTQRHAAAVQRVLAQAAKGAAAEQGGEAAGKGAGAPERGGSGSGGASGAP